MDGFWNDLYTSLKKLGADCIDIYTVPQSVLPPEAGGTAQACIRPWNRPVTRVKSALSALQTTVWLVAKEAAASGLYDTLQFPFNYLATAEETALVEG